MGSDTAGTAGDPDPNPGDRGSVLWVKDALYGDGTFNPTGTRFQYAYDSYGRKIQEINQNNVVTNYSYGGTGLLARLPNKLLLWRFWAATD